MSHATTRRVRAERYAHLPVRQSEDATVNQVMETYRARARARGRLQFGGGGASPRVVQMFAECALCFMGAPREQQSSSAGIIIVYSERARAHPRNELVIFFGALYASLLLLLLPQRGRGHPSSLLRAMHMHPPMRRATEA